MLAVVCETFTTIEKEKMKKLYLHKRKGCDLAYNLLISRNPSKELYFKQFRGLMKYFTPDRGKDYLICGFYYYLKFKKCNILYFFCIIVML